ncbi:MAG TPA: thioredoxin [Bacillota bacterium]|nr:thioredoxin [Bacillota bacterium]HPF42973.1 thioredoxin [Bacillota bacterium]HPJ86377.1 thioredoxin [Bacillota bacterium]HPQ62286.1 thioredoxin [Bacillota bacterium]HRX92058.1 thioredoxin [Candidatus Izemoplasmatales bacterium]
MEVKITNDNFKKEVLESELPVIVDFWAAWCRPCMMLGPIIKELSEDLEGKVKVGKVNVDEEGYLAQQFRVFSIPTVILFKEGKPAAQVVGLLRKEDLLKRLGL